MGNGDNFLVVGLVIFVEEELIIVGGEIEVDVLELNWLLFGVFWVCVEGFGIVFWVFFDLRKIWLNIRVKCFCCFLELYYSNCRSFLKFFLFLVF